VRAFLFRGILAGFALVCLVAIGLDAQGRGKGNPEAAKVKNPVASSPETIAAGRKIFLRYCSSCHGVNAEGGSGSDIGPPAPDLTDATWEHGSTDGEIFDTIKNGVPPDLNMAPWADQIKDPDIWNIVNFVRSMAKKK